MKNPEILYLFDDGYVSVEAVAYKNDAVINIRRGGSLVWIEKSEAKNVAEAILEAAGCLPDPEAKKG